MCLCVRVCACAFMPARVCEKVIERKRGEIIMRACGDGRISEGMGWCFFFPEQSGALAGSSGGRGYYITPQSPAVTHRPSRFVSLCACVLQTVWRNWQRFTKK